MQPQTLTAALLASLPERQRQAILDSLTSEDKARLRYRWSFWARPEQLPPAGDWQFWSYIAGRGAGKTRTGAEWVRSKVEAGYKRIALVAPTNDDFHKVMVGGESGIIACCPPWNKPEYNENKKTLTWKNGAMAFGYSAEKPARLRGPQHDCFVAGTMVSTPFGSVPIESVRVGDLVLTRNGPRRVLETRSRVATVGRISFDNGASLVGTGTHPVYISHGWTAMADLCEGDQACAIGAWSGAESAGTATEKVAAHTTSAPTKALSRSALFAFIAWCGSIITAKYRRGMTSIIETAISSITESKTLSACCTQSIVLTTLLMRALRGLSGIANLLSFLSAQTAVAMCTVGGETIASRSACRVNLDERKRSGKLSGLADSVASRSNLAPVTFAVSVASTWQPEAEARVYCFTVEDEHEYFANGILVHNCAWCDEIAAWHGKKERKPGEASRRQETWDMLMFGLRLGDNPQCFVSTTPLPVDVIRELIEKGLDEGNDAYQITRGSTYANRVNLAEKFFQQIITKYEGTRLGKQELEGELLLDVPGALWTFEMIARTREWARTRKDLPDMRRVVVAVDPSGAASANDDNSDEIGIVVVGECVNGDYWVIEDASMRGSPRQWAGAAVNAHYRHKADYIVAEQNFGGEMVRATIEGVSRNVRVNLVTASRGKVVRAEPIALLYEKNRVNHADSFARLEDQMTKMTPGGYIGDGSPDRLDAAVWGLSELSQGGNTFEFLGVF